MIEATKRKRLPAKATTRRRLRVARRLGGTMIKPPDTWRRLCRLYGLTDKQGRRLEFWLAGVPMAQIAKAERVTRQAVWKSLSTIQKRAKLLQGMGYDWRRVDKPC